MPEASWAMLESGTVLGSPGKTATFAIFRLKALAERFPKALELAPGTRGGSRFRRRGKGRGHPLGTPQ